MSNLLFYQLCMHESKILDVQLLVKLTVELLLEYILKLVLKFHPMNEYEQNILNIRKTSIKKINNK